MQRLGGDEAQASSLSLELASESERSPGMDGSMGRCVQEKAAGAKDGWRAGPGVSGGCFCKPVRSKIDCTVAEATSATDPKKFLSIVPPA